VVEHRLGRLFEEVSNPPGAPDRPIQHGPRPAGDRAAEHEKGCAVKLRCYKDYRAHCGFPRVTAFDEISSHARVRKGLRDAYRSVNDIEFYVGLFPEHPRPNSVLPRLMGCIVGIESQALTNPLLAPRVVNEDAFLPVGMPHHPHDPPRLGHPELRRPAARSLVRRDHDEI
jgi:prostaglandin-endoperoxide synthase 2